MRVLVIDDSAFMRQAITRMLAKDSSIEVVATARNGREGIELAKLHQPDVITLDVEMPEMDGLTALPQIIDQCDARVLMLSSLTSEGSHVSLTALQKGAADVLAKDTSQGALSITSMQDDLLRRVRGLGEAKPLKQREVLVRRKVSQSVAGVPRFTTGQFDMICIGSSTGGPPVLEQILAALPSTFQPPIVVAQHMPELFTRSMADRLGSLCRLRVVHAEDGATLAPQTIYIAPGGWNTHLKKRGAGRWQLNVNHGPADTIYHPSVDALLHSAATQVGGRTLGIVLTGIGDDGAQGAREVRDSGGTILAQDEASCVVYGMPKAVTLNKVAAASLSPVEMIESLQTLATNASTAA